MISHNKIKRIVKKYKFKISKKAMAELEKIINSYINEKIIKAIRQARLSGRKIIRKEDFV